MKKFHTCPTALIAFLILFLPFTATSFASAEHPQQKSSSGGQSSEKARTRTNGKIARWHDMLEIAREKDPANKPLLIKALRNESHLLRGAAAWGLSQLGGKDAQDALLEYLRRSIADRSWGDIARATEAQTELPDARALDLLIECLLLAKKHGRTYYIVPSAAKALRKIGNPKASLVIAQQLDLDVEYSTSHDYLYLAAIRDTGGKEATPVLIEYLNRLVKKMAGQKLRDTMHGVPAPREGKGVRQKHYNFEVYGLTLSALEAVTGRKPPAGSREEVSEQWNQWRKEFVGVRK